MLSFDFMYNKSMMMKSRNMVWGQTLRRFISALTRGLSLGFFS